ncbi:MAG: 3-oxoacyl-ACP reductase FabG [Planctomycetes bacterium]|nr:3-oxoacyl-ACP reductase FabG [Planctomycetota bacterium]
MSGPWALVTGASRGIGRAIAERLARDDLHIVVNYHSSEARADEVVEAIRSAGGSAEPLRFDVADEAACRTALEPLLERLDAPRVLVNNAGIVRDGLLAFMKPDEWSDVVRTNLDGLYNVTRPCLRPMLRARQGRIINLTSVAGQLGNAGQVNYSATKAGIIGFTKSLSREVAKRSITVNAVSPGLIETEMTSELPLDSMLQTVPAGRIGTANEVASVVRFLASDEAAYVTGQVIGVNGGMV